MRILLGMTANGRMLLFGGSMLFASLIALSNKGLLPLGQGDFLFLFALSTLAALYRPGWIFLLLILALPFETITLSPAEYGVDLRPYQFLEITLFLGLLIRFLLKRPLPEFPKFGAQDALLALVPIGALLALFAAPSRMLSAKLSIVLFSLFGLYVLSRIYLQSRDDLKKILPFVLASGFMVLAYALFQGIRFLLGLESFEVMPGRPDGGFPEPDWLGMYLVFFSTLLFSFGTSFSLIDDEGRRFRMAKHVGLFFSLTLVFSVLLMSVSRSAWLGAAVSGVVAVMLFAYAQRNVRATTIYAGGITAAFLFALALVVFIPLTRFDLSGRAGSIVSGDQAITVSCERETVLPEKIVSTDELAVFGCRHIDLEEIRSELSAGRFIALVKRDDPNVNIRKEIYAKSGIELREHPLLGIGWGSISSILGTDGRGAGLNASNVFLEVWLGSGILGVIAFAGFLSLVFARVMRRYIGSVGAGGASSEITFPVFVLSAVTGLLVFDLFNSGILLGFLWVLFAAAFVGDDKENA